MNRQALLIGAAYGDLQIPGVYTDLDSWSDFLSSDCGGAWRNDEIQVLKDPTLDHVRSAVLRLRDLEYSFIVFCGHGYVAKGIKPWPETRLCFGSQGELGEDELNPGTPRCTLLMDCCRGVIDMAQDRSFLAEGKSASFSQQRISARKLYEDAVARAEKGLTKIYAASLDESASDAKSFSKQLIHQSRITVEAHSGVLSQMLAVELTAEAMRKTHPQQHPEYQGGRRLNHFPFAVHV